MSCCWRLISFKHYIPLCIKPDTDLVTVFNHLKQFGFFLQMIFPSQTDYCWFSPSTHFCMTAECIWRILGLILEMIVPVCCLRHFLSFVLMIYWGIQDIKTISPCHQIIMSKSLVMLNGLTANLALIKQFVLSNIQIIPCVTIQWKSSCQTANINGWE